MKNKEYPITGMTIKPDIVDSDKVKVIDPKKLESLSKRIQELVEREKEPDLDLRIVNPETKTVTIPFQKKSDKDWAPPFPPIKLDFYNKKTKKNERIKTFYSTIIMNTLKKFGFEWENTAIDFKFSLNLSKDEKKKK